jgi:error-prone DNA polymerase
MLLVRGELRRTGPRGVSVRATGCWDLNTLFTCWRDALDQTGDPARALEAVHDLMAVVPIGFGVGEVVDEPNAPNTPSADGRTQPGQPRSGSEPHESTGDAQEHTRAGGMGRRRVLVHPSGFRQSPYADIKPSGDPVTQTRTADALPATMSDGGAADAPRKLWHSSQGSSGR